MKPKSLEGVKLVPVKFNYDSVIVTVTPDRMVFTIINPVSGALTECTTNNRTILAENAEQLMKCYKFIDDRTALDAGTCTVTMLSHYNRYVLSFRWGTKTTSVLMIPKHFNEVFGTWANMNNITDR